jgi:hypothetical protein
LELGSFTPGITGVVLPGMRGVVLLPGAPGDGVAGGGAGMIVPPGGGLPGGAGVVGPLGVWAAAVPARIRLVAAAASDVFHVMR